MGPYEKTQLPSGEWEVRDANGELMAHLGTSEGADEVIALLNEEDGLVPFYCTSCGHRDNEVEFWPSDCNPAPHVCPKCGRTNCFREGE